MELSDTQRRSFKFTRDRTHMLLDAAVSLGSAPSDSSLYVSGLVIFVVALAGLVLGILLRAKGIQAARDRRRLGLPTATWSIRQRVIGLSIGGALLLAGLLLTKR